MKITELLKKQAEFTAEIYKTNNLISSEYLSYHKKLIDCGFYKDFEIKGQPIDGFFWIRDYDLPYKDQGEGDYISIDFEVSGENLNLNYHCTYANHENGCLISIPLDLLDGDIEILGTTLKQLNAENKEQAKLSKANRDLEKRQNEIALLKLQLKNLEADK